LRSSPRVSRAAILLSTLAACGCAGAPSAERPDPGLPTAPTASKGVAADAAAAGWGTARLPDGHSVVLELAVTAEAQARGYMFRERVGDDEGMLFVYDRDDLRGFWMKNCRVPLDIIWLDAAGRVVEVAADRPPCPEEGACPSVSSSSPARFVLELAAGQAAAHGVRPGARVALLFGE